VRFSAGRSCTARPACAGWSADSPGSGVTEVTIERPDGPVVEALLATLSTVVEQIKALSEQIAEQLALHADAHIFTSLPRSGTVRAARLLAEIGDCRARYPSQTATCAMVSAKTRQTIVRSGPASRAGSSPASSSLLMMARPTASTASTDLANAATTIDPSGRRRT